MFGSLFGGLKSLLTDMLLETTREVKLLDTVL